MSAGAPLDGIRVLELAGLAPAPFAGLLLSDYGASVLRIDRPHASAHTAKPPPPTADLLTRRKASACVDLKDPRGRALIHSLFATVAILIDPYRPGVLESLSLDPVNLMKQYPHLIIARLTGFRRSGKYATMAGHDINYLAVSGVLSMLGRKDAPPYAPGNILGDFAGGGAMCFMGILMALYVRSITGKGQIVETNMVDGAAYLATMPRLATKTAMWSRPRGENLLDGGCPYYDVYETADLQHVAVGALEPQFFRSLLRGLEIPESALTGIRTDQSTWPELRSMFKIKFQKKTRREWEEIFDGTDACVTPVLSQSEIEAEESDEQVPFTLSGFFSRENSNKLDGQHRNQFDRQWMGSGLAPGEGGEVLLRDWRGWIPGRDFEVDNGGLVMLNAPKL